MLRNSKVGTPGSGHFPKGGVSDCGTISHCNVADALLEASDILVNLPFRWVVRSSTSLKFLCRQQGKQLHDGTAAMAERELGLHVDFRHRPIQLRQIKQRVVAKAAGSARRLEN